MTTRIRSLAATFRLPNVPSVLSNTFLGIVLVSLESPSELNPWSMALLLLSASCLYLAGNLFNDWYDRHWDATHRPERALPQKHFLPISYLIFGIALILLSWACAALVSPQALTISGIITLSIAIYTWMHKQSAWSVLPMSLCRALLPVMGYLGISATWEMPVLLVMVSAALMLYLLALTLSARAESSKVESPHRPRIACLIGTAVLMLITLSRQQGVGLFVLVLAPVPFTAWMTLCLTLYRKPVSRHVSNLLAGIPLVDAMLLLPLAFSVTQPGPLIVTGAILPILAFVAGKFLQRLVPAT